MLPSEAEGGKAEDSAEPVAGSEPPPPPPQPARTKASEQAASAAARRRNGTRVGTGNSTVEPPLLLGQAHGSALQGQAGVFAQQVEVDFGESFLRQPHVVRRGAQECQGVG